jgi:hypothetical protein
MPLFYFFASRVFSRGDKSHGTMELPRDRHNDHADFREKATASAISLM